METEQQLLTAIHNGERAALRRLYDRYAGFAMAIGRRYVPQGDGARDVLQDSFVKILGSLDTFSYRGEGSLKSWVSKVVSNCALDYVRKNERFTFISQIPDEADEEEPDIGDVPPDQLTEMIGRLPANYRLVLNLYVFENHSHKDIARLLNIKESTSASHFFRAKKMLARMIQAYQNKQGI